jgi:hypothetical protein
MKTLGIVPAAGKAKRFGGIMKECLPARDGSPLITHAFSHMLIICEEVVIISTPEKIAEHTRVVGGRPLYKIQSNYANDIWGAMLAGMSIEANRYWMTFPDTAVKFKDYNELIVASDPFIMCTFETDMPERFGCLQDGWIVDKSEDIAPATAWGVLSWTKVIADLWQIECPKTYTEAINMAIGEFGYSSYPLKSYHDMATIEDYRRYLNE